MKWVLLGLFLESIRASLSPTFGVKPEDLGYRHLGFLALIVAMIMVCHRLYAAADNFKCKDGLLQVPPSALNDDYCDCMDGSDEPGTSACENGLFFCQNTGYKVIICFRTNLNLQMMIAMCAEQVHPFISCE